MRKIGSFLRAIAAALRATVMVPIVIGGEIVGWVWRSLSGQAPVPDIDETVEIPDAAAEVALQQVEDGQRDREREVRLRPTQAQVLKHVARLRDERRPVDDSVYAHAFDRQKLRHYAAGLDDGDWRTILHMPEATLHRHLTTADVPGLPAYIKYDYVAGGQRAQAAVEASRTKGWTARQHYRDLLETALAIGADHVDQRQLWKKAYAKANN